MPSPTYPSAVSVENLLKSAKFWPSEEDTTAQALARAQCESGATGAADEWERLTGYNPFYVAPDAPFKTRPFNGTDHDGILDLRSAAQEIQSITYDGRVLTAESDFWLLAGPDPNALAFEPPYTAIRFLRPLTHSSRPAMLRIVARWGYCTAIPPYAWQQILQGAALVALTSIENLQNVASLSIDGFNKAFDTVGVITPQNLLQTWGKDFLKAAQLYTRVSAQ